MMVVPSSSSDPNLACDFTLLQQGLIFTTSMLSTAHVLVLEIADTSSCTADCLCGNEYPYV